MNSLLFGIVAITVSAVIVVLLFEMLMRWLRSVIIQRTNRQIIRRLVNIFRLVFYSFLVIVLLGIWGVNLVAILAGAGFLGIIIGLAVQQPLGNFFSGVYVVVSRIIKEGETISINAIGNNISVEGVVHHIGFAHTELIDKKGKLNIIPNNVIVSSILRRQHRHAVNTNNRSQRS